MNVFKGIFYYLNLAWVKFLLFLITSVEVIDRENTPKKGPIIIVCNHLNNADPPILTGTIPRRIYWLTKIEWFKKPVIGYMFRMAGMIPVKRFEADLHALRMCERALKKGWALGMFPEGTRSKGGSLRPGEAGSALLALRTGAPILPVAIWGTENVKLPRDMIGRTRAHVRFGKTFVIPRKEKISREDVAEANTTIMKSIAALLPEKYRGVYADDGSPHPLAPSPPPEADGRGEKE
ncbi:MAG: lysophospholipid acyltransferase family protein [Chloroflexota bacterium]